MLLKSFFLIHFVKKNKLSRNKISPVICEFAQIAPDLKEGRKNIIREKRYNKFLSYFSNLFFRQT